jgi:hypothetical protein
MKKFFFYSSIIILCILIWVNKKIIEGNKNKGNKNKGNNNKGNNNKGNNNKGNNNKGNRNNANVEDDIIEREYKNMFGLMSIEDLRDIYDTIENAKNSNPDDEDIKNADESQVGLMSFGNPPSNTTENAEESQVVNNGIVICSNSTIILQQLRDLNINNDAFNAMLISKDATTDDAVYKQLIENLKKLGYIEYKQLCSAKKKKKKNKKKGTQNEICLNYPKCHCLPQELCNNYTYLKSVYEDEAEDALLDFITNESNNIIYSELLKQKLPVTVEDLDKFKQDTLPDYFFPRVPQTNL